MELSFQGVRGYGINIDAFEKKLVMIILRDVFPNGNLRWLVSRVLVACGKTQKVRWRFRRMVVVYKLSSHSTINSEAQVEYLLWNSLYMYDHNAELPRDPHRMMIIEPLED